MPGLASDARGEQPTNLLVLDQREMRFRLAETTRLATAEPLALVQVARPYRALWVTRGTEADGWMLPGKSVQIRLFPDRRPGRRQVVVTLSAPSQASRAQRYTLRSGHSVRGGRLAPGTADRVSFTTCAPRRGVGVATLAAEGDARLPDNRIVTVHLDRIEARAAPGACPQRQVTSR